MRDAKDARTATQRDAETFQTGLRREVATMQLDAKKFQENLRSDVMALLAGLKQDQDQDAARATSAIADSNRLLADTRATVARLVEKKTKP